MLQSSGQYLKSAAGESALIRCRPQYAVFPEDEGGFAIDDQYYVGDSGILIKPVTSEGANTADVYLADNQVSLSMRPCQSC